MSPLQSFNLWLSQKGYSDSTIRNYIVDINKYIEYIRQKYSTEPDGDSLLYRQLFSSDYLSEFIDQIYRNKNSQRYLASLNLFCQFGVDQQLISSNPITKLRRKINQNQQPDPIKELQKLSSDFSDYLSAHSQNQTTIKNYINDINQYINWLNTQKFGSQ